MAKAFRNRASKQHYSSEHQLPLPGFETPFARKLNPANRWVLLAHKIPWDGLVNVYQTQMHNTRTGADGINPRVAIGSLIIKHMCDLSDRETVLQIQENMYMQYFIGFSSFSDEEPFDPSLFVEFRKRLGADQINRINEIILGLSDGRQQQNKDTGDDNSTQQDVQVSAASTDTQRPNEGRLIVDATACPQDIRYPTDLDLLNDAREKSEELIDLLFCATRHIAKPRTYRRVAHKIYLKTAQKKSKSKKELRTAIKRQLNYLRRNIKNIHKLLEEYKSIPLDRHQYKYLLVQKVKGKLALIISGQQ